MGLGGGLVCAPDRPWIRGLRARPGRQVSEHLDSARPPEPKLGLLIHCYFDRERLFDNTRQLVDLLSMFARQGMIEKKNVKKSNFNATSTLIESIKYCK